MLPKFIVYSLSFIVLILFTALPASAQTTNYQLPTTVSQDPSTSLRMGLPSNVSPTSPLYTDLLVHNLFHSFSCLATGQSVIGQPCLSYQVTKNAQGMLQGVPVLSQVNTSGGTLAGVTSVMGMLYQNPPVRTADYLASVGQGLGIVKTANAQVVGSGEAVLNPILRLWQVSRNISYVLMIVIFLVIGLMVMFRNKINPQTVITAQAALPGLVIGLILITFSYFLAGLISDMAFVGTNVVGYYFSAARGEADNPQNLVQEISNQNALSVFSPFTGIIDKDMAANMLSGIWDSLGDSAQTLLTALAVFVTAQTTTQGTELLKAIPEIGEAIQAVIVGSAGIAAWRDPTAMAGVALAFIATAILLYSMFKLLLRLINAYLTIIFLTFTAPFQFLAAALPGRQGIATGWILNMLANILAFPAVLAVLYFIAFILGPGGLKNCPTTGCPFKVSQVNQINNTNLIVPAHAAQTINIVDGSTFPLFGGFNLDFVRIILAFGALVALPSIPDIISRTIGKMSQTGQMIGQEISGGIGQGRQYAGQFQGGVGAASGQLAKGRGLFDTTAYSPGEIDPDTGKVKTWVKNPFQYQAGKISKVFGKKDFSKTTDLTSRH